MLDRRVFRQADAPLAAPKVYSREEKLTELENFVRSKWGYFGEVPMTKWCLGHRAGLIDFIESAAKYEPLAAMGLLADRRHRYCDRERIEEFSRFFSISREQTHRIGCRSAYFGHSERIRAWRIIRHIRQVRNRRV